MPTYNTKFISAEGGMGTGDYVYLPSAATSTHDSVTLHSLSVGTDNHGTGHNAAACYMSIWKAVGRPTSSTTAPPDADWTLAQTIAFPNGVPKMANAHVVLAEIESSDRIAIGFSTDSPANISDVDSDNGWDGRVVNVAYSYTDKLSEMANL